MPFLLLTNLRERRNYFVVVVVVVPFVWVQCVVMSVLTTGIVRRIAFRQTTWSLKFRDFALCFRQTINIRRETATAPRLFSFAAFFLVGDQRTFS